MSEQDALAKSLLELEEQLSSLGTVQQVLAKAQEGCELATQKLTEAEQSWESWTAEQKQLIGELVRVTAQSVTSVHTVTEQLESVGSSLLSLGNAIQRVDFPQRLDKIDLAVSSQLALMTALQAEIERKHLNLLAEIEQGRSNMVADSDARQVVLLTQLEMSYANLLTESGKRHDSLLAEIEKNHTSLLAESGMQYDSLFAEIKEGNTALLDLSGKRYDNLLVGAEQKYAGLLSDANEKHDHLQESITKAKRRVVLWVLLPVLSALSVVCLGWLLGALR